MNSKDFRQKANHIPFAREGIPFIAAVMFVTFITAILGWAVLSCVLIVLTLLVGHFFRDPERVGSMDEQDVISPADGTVIAIQTVDGSHFTRTPCIKISIFMSIFDVHVNRVPISGTVQGVFYKKGRFHAANFARASGENEQNWLWVRSDAGVDVVLTQVAGLIARRIVCWPSPGDRVDRGERFGMIRFGSRMDVYVPEGSEINVSQGDHVYGGETVLCRLK